ncbi:MAG: hypothetical protein QXI89_00295 [Candidatus Anstonellales archaeon]
MAIKSRGIPSKEAFWLPAFYSNDIRQFQDENENLTRSIWKLDEILNFIFPRKYQETYYNVALAFMNYLFSFYGHVESKQIAEFVKNNKISKATFYNRVLPRLKRLGLIRIRRETELGANKKYRRMRIEISKTFGNYLLKIANSWLAHVDDIKEQRQMNAKKEQADQGL